MTVGTKAPEHVAALEIKVDGNPLDIDMRARGFKVRIEDDLRLPAVAVLHLSEADKPPVNDLFTVGARIEVSLSPTKSFALRRVFEGQVRTLAWDFGSEGVCRLQVEAHDALAMLHGDRGSDTFQGMSSAQIVDKVVSDRGLECGTIEDTGGTHKFFQQSMETGWEVCGRLAAMHDFELRAEDGKVHFRKAFSSEAPRIDLTWKDNLRWFCPRVTGVGQVKRVSVRQRDPLTDSDVRADVDAPEPSVEAPVVSDRPVMVQKLRGGTALVGNRVVNDNEEAKDVGQAVINAPSFTEAEGEVDGDPLLRAGARVNISGVSARLCGEYPVSSVTHVYEGNVGYTTRFVCASRRSNTLLAAMTPSERRGWADSIVIGEVTNTNDPEKLGCVRVKFPTLEVDKPIESAWARVAGPHAGGERGLMFMPQIGDEVVVCFEHGDTRRPFVLGSLYHGRAKPTEEMLQGQDGSFVVTTPGQAIVATEKDALIRAKNVTIEASENVKIVGKRIDLG